MSSRAALALPADVLDAIRTVWEGSARRIEVKTEGARIVVYAIDPKRPHVRIDIMRDIRQGG